MKLPLVDDEHKIWLFSFVIRAIMKIELFKAGLGALCLACK